MPRLRLTNDAGKRVLARIRRIRPFVQASLSITKKQCGTPTCRCAREGPVHETALLTWKQDGRTRTLHVPADLREEVARWVEEGKLLKSLIAQMSAAQQELLRERRRSRS